MLGKYKILGILTLSAIAGYGIYEAYNYFSPTHALLKHSEKASTMEDDEDVLQHEEEEEYPVDESKTLKSHEEDLNPPEIQQPIAPEKPPTQTKINSPSNSLKQKTMTEHLNEDGTIKIRPDTLGNKFQNYLITASEDDDVGKNKISYWQEDIRYHEENKKNKREHKNPIPQEFLLRSPNINVKNLHRKCASAYNKKKWQDLKMLKTPYNRVTREREYWAIVGKYCGKPLQETPKGGYPG